MAVDSQAKAKALDRAGLMNAFEGCVSRRCYKEALALCQRQLKAKPDDRLAAELFRTVEGFVDASDDLEVQEAANAAAGEEEEIPPPIEELVPRASAAKARGAEVAFEYLRADEARLWEAGAWALQPLLGIACGAEELLEVLQRKLRPALKSETERFDDFEWLLEAVAEAWYLGEQNRPIDTWLSRGLNGQWAAAGGSMELLVGFSSQGLAEASAAELDDVLTNALTLERAFRSGAVDEGSSPLTYGVERVLAEVGSRPLVEAPLDGFFDCLFLMTHVVYAINGYNSCLPNRRADFPWLYAYLERCLTFLLRELRNDRLAQTGGGLLSRAGRLRALEAVAEIVDCLRGLGPEDEGSDSDTVREGVVWLLNRQDPSDGYFYSPGFSRQDAVAADPYACIRPTTAAVVALQLEREATVVGSSQAQAWTAHARAAAAAVQLSTAPPPPRPSELQSSEP
eukprot:TRINITY_DN63076_c0_g1_i1.p1 TRINITY_DN63076_c0_g1~~TRINITY_DN63076_c0_g1_i1.p1  ORF type:complete len:455 (-),score=127.29 TRINITY_DN63076_c0_g1_i1:74-1438(-)